MEGLSELKLCVDRIVPDEFGPVGAVRRRAMLDVADSLPPIRPGEAPGRARAAILTPNKWPNGTSVRCRFLDGDDVQCRRVEEKAHIWEDHANIRFEFVRSTDEHVRISFTEDGSWSALGTDALNERYFPSHQPTMNYGWLAAESDEYEYNRVVLHEFGHALGLVHEHSSPGASLEWNEDEVYRRFSGSPNFWSREEINFNILQKYGQDQSQYTGFDNDSIMLYAFPPELFDDWQGTKHNSTLSQTDIDFISSVYPPQ